MCPVSISIGCHQQKATRMSLIVLLQMFLLLYSPSAVSTLQAAYHIRPTSESPCPYQDCLTLSEYATETSRYTNSNNLTLLFLPGEHVLNTSIEFQFLDSLSLLGDQSSLPNITSKITCNGVQLFTLINITFVEIKALSIVKCGDQNSSDGYQNNVQVLSDTFGNVTVAKSVIPAISTLFLTNFQLVNCHLDSNFLPVLLNKSRLCLKNNTLSDNKGSFGGAIAVYNSTVEFLGKNTFLSNEAVVGGGVFASSSSLVFVGSTLYVNNTAEYSSCFNAYYSTSNANTSRSTVKKICTTHFSAFLQTFAQHDGGGILLVNSILIQNQGLLNFTGNRADNGGAISSHQSHISLNGFAMFECNSAAGLGGAVSVRNGTWNSAVVRFVYNSAENGGAMYTEYSRLSLVDGLSAVTTSNTFSGQIFLGNEAFSNGGGIFLNEASTLNISGSGTYVGNTAMKNGGMICAQFHSSVTLNGNISFTGNRAQLGGGIAITEDGLHFESCLKSVVFATDRCSIASFSGNISWYSNVAEYGGGVYLRESNVRVIGKVTYANNTAHSGGGMYMQGSILALTGVGSYGNNTALEDGGGIFVDDSRVVISGTSTYINNSAINGHGGVINACSSLIKFKGVVSFFYNKASLTGGGISLRNSTLNITGIGNYISNSAESFGGVINVDDSRVVIFGTSTYINNSVINGHGGVINAWSSLIKIKGVVSFFYNKAGSRGGCISLRDSILNITGIGDYISNSAESFGGAINARGSKFVLIGENSFIGNCAMKGGGISSTDKSTGFLLGKTSLLNNNAEHNGGGIYLSGIGYNILIISGTGVCINNTAGTTKSPSDQDSAGGVIFLRFSTLDITGNVTYLNNTAKASGGAIFGSDSKINMDGRIILRKNCAEKHGGAIALNHCTIWINRYNSPWSVHNITFEGNEVNYSGGALYTTESKVTVYGVTSVVNNVANFHGYGGGFHAIRTGIILNGLHYFENNSASNGGGMAIEFYGNYGFLSISQIAFLSFVNNRAEGHGGAIFVSGAADYTCSLSESVPQESCVVRFIGNFGTKNLPHIRLPYEKYRNITGCIGHAVFEDNIASNGGYTIFGGGLYNCIVDIRFEDPCEYPACRKKICYMPGIEAVAALTHSSVQELTRDPFNIMSDTYRVCIYDSEKPNCKQMASNYTIYPGETISVSVTVVGKQNLVAFLLNVIQARISDSQKVWLDKRQDTQSINYSCSSLEYTLFASVTTSAKLTLSVDGPCHSKGLSHYIYLSMLKCPFGFYSQFGSCICERRLQRYTNSCDINTRSITRSGDFWVGFDRRSHGLILHPHCSFDYCKLETVSFTINSTDLQCAYGRSSILCGTCKPGFSLKLGNSQCSSCSNVFLLLFIPFAIAGFLLVVFLFICKVTVAAGTTSGLIFYANVLAVNKSVFFAASETNFLTVFIAWLNLDLGIETCFIDGMDMYTRTWLQFVFPLYIWLLVGIIVLVSRRSTFVARIIGPTNPVSVLATLFLLSYTKLLRTIIATLSFTTLDYPDDKSVTVWVYDGNIEYFKGKHIPLFLAGLLAFLLLFLPYTLLLLFGQWIEAGSSRRLLSWINKPTVKYFLDAYHAPYKNQHRYWTGLLLLFRFLLFITSAIVDINSPRDPSINFLILGIICVGLMILVWNTGSMFRKQHSNILESSFILNLTILALSSLYVRLEGGNQTAVVYTSVGIAFATFLGIITFHVVELSRDSRIWRIAVMPKLQNLKQILMHHEEQHGDIELTAPPTAPPQPVPTTFVELREPLLESQH